MKYFETALYRLRLDKTESDIAVEEPIYLIDYYIEFTLRQYLDSNKLNLNYDNLTFNFLISSIENRIRRIGLVNKNFINKEAEKLTQSLTLLDEYLVLLKASELYKEKFRELHEKYYKIAILRWEEEKSLRRLHNHNKFVDAMSCLINTISETIELDKSLKSLGTLYNYNAAEEYNAKNLKLPTNYQVNITNECKRLVKHYSEINEKYKELIKTLKAGQMHITHRCSSCSGYGDDY